MKNEPVPVRSALMIAGAALLWGTVSIVVKGMVNFVDAPLIAFVRMALAGAVLTIVAASSGRLAVRRKDWTLVAVAAFGIAFNYLFFTLGLRYTSASAGSMVVQTEVIFLAVLSAILLRERFTPKKIAGMGMALLGVALISWNGHDLSYLLASEHLFGNLVIVLAGLFWAFYAFCQKQLSEGSDLLSPLSPIFLLAAALLLPFTTGSLGKLGQLSPIQGMGLLYLGLVCTALSYLLLAKGMRTVPASTAGVLTTLMPISSVILAHVFLCEQLTLYLAAGAVLDLGGVLLVIKGG